MPRKCNLVKLPAFHQFYALQSFGCRHIQTVCLILNGLTHKHLKKNGYSDLMVS